MAGPDAVDGDVVLRVVGVSKTYPGTRALRDVCVEIRTGEIHALVGSNGSGKSTLVKTLAGVEHADAGGTFVLAGHELPANRMTPATANRLGLRFVHQDPGVFGYLSVAENLAIGRGYPLGPGGRIRWRALRRRAVQELARIGLDCHPDTPVERLSPATRTLVAVARALREDGDGGATVLVLDEPTAALPKTEADRLLATLRRVADAGVAVLLVTHRLDEVVGVADRASVFRDGALVATVAGAGLTQERLVEYIVGRPLEAVFPSMPVPRTDAAVLTVEDVSVGPLRELSFNVCRGEVVGIAGLLGTGRTTLLRSIFGDVPVGHGRIAVDGREVSGGGPEAAIRGGVGYVPEDRGGEAVFPELSVRANLLAASVPDFWRRYGMGARAEDTEAGRLIADFGIKARHAGSSIASLSGGNQQKCVLARWLRRKPALLLLDEPTQGVDVGARAEIYQIIRDAVDHGTAVLLVASDFDELARVSDRVLVVRHGRLVAEVKPPELAHEYLTRLAYTG